MKINVKKIAKILIVFVLLITVFYTISNADNFGDTSKFTPKADNLGKGQQLLESGGATVVTFIRILGAGIALIIILVLAMKYMMAAAGDRADVKRSMIPYLIVAFIFFGAGQILGLLFDVSQEIK